MRTLLDTLGGCHSPSVSRQARVIIPVQACHLKSSEPKTPVGVSERPLTALKTDPGVAGGLPSTRQADESCTVTSMISVSALSLQVLFCLFLTSISGPKKVMKEYTYSSALDWLVPL